MTESPANRTSHPIVLTSAQDPSFPAAETLRQLVESGSGNGKQATLLRVALLRRDYPDARIEIDLAHHDPQATIIKASVTLPTGASASGFATGSVSRLHLIETEAIANALDLLGHTLIVAGATEPASFEPATHPASDEVSAGVPAYDNTPFDPDVAPEELEDATAETAPFSPVRSDMESVPPERQVLPRPEAPRIGQPTPRAPGTPPAVIDAVRRSNLRRHTPMSIPDRPDDGRRVTAPTTPAPRDDAPPVAADANASDQPPLEDYSWTAFWRVARPQGLDKVKVEALIGRTIEGMNPGDVRTALAAAGVEI
ncbi:MAG TPA: hypothetical protein VFQ54_04090 [Thermomicrobiales bacterium]|nr:hypothetical protein [Thermomicrobiales bacterium]